MHWDVESGTVGGDIGGIDCIIHLAGEPITPPWTCAKRKGVYESRVTATDKLCGFLVGLRSPPQLLCASATGFYGSRGEDALSEASPAGRGYLAEVCRAWEAATAVLAARARVVNLRFGMVLDAHGGALPRILLPYRLCMGGKLGDGRQWWSWITLEDAARAIVHIVNQPDLAGPVNIVTPQPVRNAEFSKTLSRVLHRPALLSLPRPIVRLAFGELADELFLASLRVQPERLTQAGFSFQHPSLSQAIAQMLGDRRCR